MLSHLFPFFKENPFKGYTVIFLKKGCFHLSLLNFTLTKLSLIIQLSNASIT